MTTDQSRSPTTAQEGYAVIKTGGHQAIVFEGDVLDIPSRYAEEEVTFIPVLVVDGDGAVITDHKRLAELAVKGRVLGESHARKVDGLYDQNRPNHGKSEFHRQTYTTVEITEISTPAVEKAAANKPAARFSAQEAPASHGPGSAPTRPPPPPLRRRRPRRRRSSARIVNLRLIVDEATSVVVRFLTAFQMVLERHRVGLLRTGFAITLSGGLVLRFAVLSRLGINSDEAVYSGQAATLAGIGGFAEDFSIFRAHPLLYQYTVSIVYRVFGFNEVNARLVSALFGVATVFIVYFLGKRLVDRRTGLLAATIITVMPLHVIVSRQALLEVPMTFFYSAAIYALIAYLEAFDDSEKPAWEVWTWAAAIGALTGLAFMSKEVAGILLVVVFVAMLVTKHFRIGHGIVVVGVFLSVISPHLLALSLGPGSEGGGGWAEYVIWQVARPANHPIGFYLGNVWVYFGLPLLFLFVVGLGMSIRRAQERPELVALALSVIVPVWFFQVWKVKGFHYIVPIAPVVAVLAAYVLVNMWKSHEAHLRGFASLAAFVTVGSLIWISATNGPIVENYSRVGQAGYSGIPGGREAALWLDENAPKGSRILGIGPSIGNMIRWYSDHQTSALSVSPNPLRANPAYTPVRNPDFELRWGLIEYLIYDAYSAARTPHFANRLLDFVERYGGEIVHEEYAPLIGEDGEQYVAPVIRIYRVGPVGIDPEPADSSGGGG